MNSTFTNSTNNATTTTANVTSIFWISDLILTNPKSKEPTFDVISNLHLWDGLVESAALLTLHALSFVINIFLFTLIINNRRIRKTMKLRIMIMALTVLNIIFNITWFFCIVIHYLLSMEEEGALLDDIDRDFSNLVWEICGHQFIDSLLAVQSLFLLSLSLDRYLNLFVDYSPYVRSVCEGLLIAFVPFLLGTTLFDHRLLTYLVPLDSALFARMCALLIPHLLSFILLLVASMRPPPVFVYEPRLSYTLAKSLPVVLFMIVVIDLFARVGLFFELLEVNYRFLIVTGSEQGDRFLNTLFDWWYQISHFLLHSFPLYSALSLLLFVRHHREMAGRIVPGICCCRKKKEKVNYNSETMRSIIAEQRRVKMMASSIH